MVWNPDCTFLLHSKHFLDSFVCSSIGDASFLSDLLTKGMVIPVHNILDGLNFGCSEFPGSGVVWSVLDHSPLVILSQSGSLSTSS